MLRYLFYDYANANELFLLTVRLISNQIHRKSFSGAGESNQGKFARSLTSGASRIRATQKKKKTKKKQKKGTKKRDMRHKVYPRMSVLSAAESKYKRIALAHYTA
jgi:hypothetical protein